MSLLVNLVSSSDGNDISVGLTWVVYLLFYLEQIFLPSHVCIHFLTVIATCNTFQQYCNNISDNCNTCVVIQNPERVAIVVKGDTLPTFLKVPISHLLLMVRTSNLDTMFSILYRQ